MLENNQSAQAFTEALVKGQLQKTAPKAQEEKKPGGDFAPPMPEESKPLTFAQRPEKDLELIQGILLLGGLQQICAPSKACKSYWVIQLGGSLALGRSFLDFYEVAKPCKVYIANTEMRPKSYDQRAYDIIEELLKDLPKEERDLERELYGDNLTIGHLKGTAIDTIQKFCNFMYKKREEGFEVVIIDPIYPLFPGDENSVQDWNRELLRIDKLAKMLELTVIFTHHFGKGSTEGKQSQSLGSGSSLKERKVDDTETHKELYITNAVRVANDWDETVRGFSIEHSTREFFAKPVRVYFQEPLFHMDTKGALKGLPEITSRKAQSLMASDAGEPQIGQKEKAQATELTRAEKKEIANRAICEAILEAFTTLDKSELNVTETALELERIATRERTTHPDLPVKGASTYRKDIPLICALYPEELKQDPKSGAISKVRR